MLQTCQNMNSDGSWMNSHMKSLRAEQFWQTNENQTRVGTLLSSIKGTSSAPFPTFTSVTLTCRSHMFTPLRRGFDTRDWLQKGLGLPTRSEGFGDGGIDVSWRERTTPAPLFSKLRLGKHRCPRLPRPLLTQSGSMPSVSPEPPRGQVDCGPDPPGLLVGCLALMVE